MSSEDEQMNDDTTGRHPVNVAHLVMGIAFLGLALVWALYQADLVGPGDLRWFLPVPWLLAGLAGLLAITLAGRRAAPGARPRDDR